jgi:ribosome-associated protein
LGGRKRREGGQKREAIIIPVDTKQTYPEEHNEPEPPSKSQRKRESAAAQDLGEELVTLSPERLKKIDMPDALRLAVRDAQRISKHEARRRQMQYIGKLMRGVDPAPIKAALDEVNGVSAAANARQHRLERLRTQLMESEDTLGEIATAYPGADLQYLRQLRRNALKEQQLAKPPRAYRELFRVLRDLQNEPGTPVIEDTEEDDE